MLELAERDGVPVDDVLVADASRRTTALNAYVSGFGSSRRIVALRHARRAGDARGGRARSSRTSSATPRRTTCWSARCSARSGAAAAVCGLALLLSWAPVLRRSGADGMHDPRVVPLRARARGGRDAASSRPASNLVSRRIEARADVHSLDLTRDPQAFADSQRRLALTNLSDLDPHPLAYALFATHPTTTERLAMAREWERLRGDGR